MTKKYNKFAITKQLIENGTIPRYIYKYVNFSSAKEIINKNTIKFNLSSSFNDPFDGKAFIEANLPYEELDKITFLDRMDKTLKEVILKTIKKSDFAKMVNKYINDNTSISCFSKVDDNLLMWSHYADEHKGMCFKFDISKDYDFFCIPVKVEYKKDFLIYKITEIKDFLLKQYSTKGLDWEYEQEVRVIKPNTVADYISFNKESLVEITFGSKCLDEFIIEIKKLLSESGYNNTSLRIAKISEKSYELNFNSI